MKKVYQTAEVNLIYFSDVIITSGNQGLTVNSEKEPETPIVSIGD